MPSLPKIPKLPPGAGALTRVLKNKVKLEPKVISVEAARRCCESTQKMVLTETLNYANSLARAIFEPPQIRQAGFALRLEIPPVLVSVVRAVVPGASNIIPVEFAPIPPLRVVNPGGVESAFFEADIPADPTYETFTSYMTSVALNLEALAKKRGKECLKANGFPPNNQRHWKKGGRNTRK